MLSQWDSFRLQVHLNSVEGFWPDKLELGRALKFEIRLVCQTAQLSMQIQLFKINTIQLHYYNTIPIQIQCNLQYNTPCIQYMLYTTLSARLHIFECNYNPQNRKKMLRIFEHFDHDDQWPGMTVVMVMTTRTGFFSTSRELRSISGFDSLPELLQPP